MRWLRGMPRVRHMGVAVLVGAVLALAGCGTGATMQAANFGGPAVDVAVRGGGQWTVTANGDVDATGGAPALGSLTGTPLARPIVGITPTPSGNGYWLVASDGGVFSFGDAVFHGSTGDLALNRAVVGMASTPSGNGYWLVASDGGIFSFGDAAFHGGTGAMPIVQPIVTMITTPTGNGYWLVASDGGVFSFGDAVFQGGTGAMVLNRPIVDAAATATGGGYWLLGSDGGTFSFGDATFQGAQPTTGPTTGAVGIARADGGYRIARSDGSVLAFPNAVGASALAAPSREDTIANDVFERINQERRARGIPVLSWDADLAAGAQAWSASMAGRGVFAHSGASGENIYTGMGSLSTAGVAHSTFMNSAGHAANVLSSSSRVGIGVSCVNGRVYLTERFGGPAFPSQWSPLGLTGAVRADGGGPGC